MLIKSFCLVVDFIFGLGFSVLAHFDFFGLVFEVEGKGI